MPFTLAHAAAALPLRRLKLVWSAVVIGTLAPDFEYFLKVTDVNRDAHHFPQLLTFTLPVALIVLWFFHRLLKEPLVELAPEGLQRRLTPCLRDFSFGGARRFAAILFSLCIGIATHLAWDAITHARTWPYYHGLWLRQYGTFTLFGQVHVMPHHEMLQHLSSIGGCAALLVWLALWYRRTSPVQPIRNPVFSPALRTLILMAMLSLPWVAALLIAAQRGHMPEDFLRTKIFAEYLVLVPGTLLWMEIFAYALVTTRLQKLQRAERG